MARWFVAALGSLVVCAGAFGLVQPLGLERMQGLADWGTGLDATILRAVGLVAAGPGAFFVWSVWPRRRES
jgi:hypothetical protein